MGSTLSCRATGRWLTWDRKLKRGVGLMIGFVGGHGASWCFGLGVSEGFGWLEVYGEGSELGVN